MEAEATIRRRKPEELRKGETVRIRVTADQHARLREAALRAEMDLSTWARDLLLKAARTVPTGY